MTRWSEHILSLSSLIFEIRHLSKEPSHSPGCQECLLVLDVSLCLVLLVDTVKKNLIRKYITNFYGYFSLVRTVQYLLSAINSTSVSYFSRNENLHFHDTNIIAYSPYPRIHTWASQKNSNNCTTKNMTLRTAFLRVFYLGYILPGIIVQLIWRHLK